MKKVWERHSHAFPPHYTPEDNFPIFAGIHLLSFTAKESLCLQHAMPWIISVARGGDKGAMNPPDFWNV